MAKIRGIKPDLWTDEDFVELTPLARLLWLGMWNYACDNGHLADKSKQIKMRVLPTDEVNCAELLREIEAQGLIERADGWITIPNLTRHQRPDRRYFTTCEKAGCNEPPETVSQRAARRAPTVHTPGTPSAHDGRTPGAHVDGDGEVKGSDGDRSRKRAHQLPDDFRPTDKHVALAESLGVDLRREWPKFTDHHRAKGSTMKDWSAALNNWIRKAVEYGGATVHQFRPAVGDDGQPVLPPLPQDDKR